MRFRIATVISSDDFTTTNTIKARLKNTSIEEVIQVSYTSPYANVPNAEKGIYNFHGLGGMVPTTGTDILIARVEESDSWMFISSVVTPQSYDTGESDGCGDATEEQILEGTGGVSYSMPVPLEEQYSHGIKSSKIGLTSKNGDRLIMSESGNKKDFDNFTQLKDYVGKGLNMSESSDMVTLTTEVGDGLRISGEESDSYVGPRGIELRCQHNLGVETDQGELGIRALGGAQQLVIENKGIKNGTASPGDETPGQIVVESYHNDINIKVNGLEGRRIFIDASDGSGLIQVRAGIAGVEIFSDGDVDFKTSGNFNINADGDVNIRGNNIHLNPNFTFGKTEPTKNNEELMQ